MIRKIDDFIAKYTEEAKFTQGILDCLTDESLSQSICEGHRDLGRIAWHVCMTIPEMMSFVGFTFDKYDAKAEVPKTGDEIKTAYRELSKDLLAKIKENWDDAKLDETAEFYGEQWPLRGALMGLLLHEVHHRGQLTVLMRQANLSSSDIYGPTKEGWAKMNMEEPKI